MDVLSGKGHEEASSKGQESGKEKLKPIKRSVNAQQAHKSILGSNLFLITASSWYSWMAWVLEDGAEA